VAGQAGGSMQFAPGQGSAAAASEADAGLQWADFRSAVARIRAHHVLLLGLLMIAVQVAWKAQFLNHLYFRQDDFHDLDLAVEHHFTWSYLTFIGSGHLIIGLRAIAWMLVRGGGTYNWTLASSVSMVFVAAADLAGLRLLRDLFGERPAILIPFGIYLLTPLTMPDLGIWSSAMESVPLQLAIFMAISAHLRYVHSGGWPHLAGAAFWLAFGLAFFEKALVLPVALFALTAAYFCGGSVLQGCRAALLRYWRAWVVYVVLTAGYLVVLIEALRTSASQPRVPISADRSFRFAWELIRDTFVPGAFGGPWHWLPVSGESFAFADPPHVLVAVTMILALLVIVMTTLRRRIAARAWAILLGWVLLADILPVIVGRLNTIDVGILGLETRYVADATPFLALCIGLAFLPLTEARRFPAARGHAAQSGQRSHPATVIMIALYVFGSIWSVQAYLNATTGAPAANYVGNASAAIKLAPRGATVMNLAVPGTMVEGLFHEYALQSKVIGDISPGRLHWTQHPRGTIDGLRIFGPDGRLYQAYVRGVASVPLAAGQKCWPATHGTITITLDRLSPNTTGIMRIGYLSFAARKQTIIVQAGTNMQTMTVARGLHSGYVPVSGRFQQVTITTSGPGLCVGDVEAGNLRPRLIAPALPPRS
jgi:hypothetical protein